MSIAIDPSEMRVSAPVKRRGPSRVGHLALLTVLGSAGLVGLSVGAYSMLSGLAGPSASGVRIGRVSADWPDLRDGVPALVSTAKRPDPVSAPVTVVEPIRTEAAIVSSEGVTADAKLAATTDATVAAKLSDIKPADSARVEAKPTELRPAEAPRPAKVASIAPAAKPARLPVIENAATVPPAPAVPLVEKARSAPIVAPTAHETTRARAATGTSFAALPPAAAATDAPKPKAAVARAKPAGKPAPAAAATERVAAAQPPQAAEPEAEETEVFGMKVPSLAPVGRKFAEGVEAIGNAVKRLPEQF
ncbi:hypothetical protein PMNALOAF_0577 [Methylobacterium adhaesivum]|uniref:Chemotaxis protein CheA n=1 Tax=Methylobacterium adhaesivum TaxID=333297 RepID=A0ABT8BMV4_9HYPH|nr:hypothetical protein [Methylobacterium adhaesivum]MDN3592710.1 hypothetical protein [Methylobacterium adhaesivum]GJD29344.1 hypothetical protein PMNALOAF_0577 [Methylobacterium adhaesivum]